LCLLKHVLVATRPVVIDAGAWRLPYQSNRILVCQLTFSQRSFLFFCLFCICTQNTRFTRSNHRNNTDAIYIWGNVLPPNKNLFLHTLTEISFIYMNSGGRAPKQRRKTYAVCVCSFLWRRPFPLHPFESGRSAPRTWWWLREVAANTSLNETASVSHLYRTWYWCEQEVPTTLATESAENKSKSHRHFTVFWATSFQVRLSTRQQKLRDPTDLSC